MPFVYRSHGRVGSVEKRNDVKYGAHQYFGTSEIKSQRYTANFDSEQTERRRRAAHETDTMPGASASEGAQLGASRRFETKVRIASSSDNPCDSKSCGSSAARRSFSMVNHVVVRCGVSSATVNRNIVQKQKCRISRVNCRPAASDAA